MSAEGNKQLQTLLQESASTNKTHKSRQPLSPAVSLKKQSKQREIGSIKDHS